ncbi:MAG: hypothetical protein J6W56_02765 [Prevotella sp.]|nr:hypothetical protein [Prevotella sp.]
MAYIFDDWKEVLDNFQSSVEKDLEEIHKQKAELLQIKVDIFNKIESGLFYRDEDRIVISAPEVIIGNVDKSGMLVGEAGRVIIKGHDVAMEGVGSTGSIVSRAPSIRQVAVNPGIDGLENVVCETSQIVSQACDIVLHSSDAKDVFSQDAVPAGQGGVRIHADNNLSLEAAVSAENRKQQIEATVKNYSEQIQDLKKQMEAQKKNVDSCFKKMSDALDKEEKLNQSKDYLTSINVYDITQIHEEMEDVMPMLYQSTQAFISVMSRLAEMNRQKKALEEEKGKIKTGDDFKKKTTGASMNVVAETINVVTADGDGNVHSNNEAGINVRAPRMDVAMLDEKDKLVENGGFAVTAQNISLASVGLSADGKEMLTSGVVNIQAKDINLQAIDYKINDNKMASEKELTADGKIAMTAKTVEVSTANPSNVERDDDGKLSKGEYKSEGDVIFKTKTFTVESLDYEVKDGKLETKALTTDGRLSIRAEKTDVLAADAEGKATGSISLNAKAVAVKSMNVDKEKLTDDKLAEGSTMTLVSEKMYVGAKSKDIKSKKLQAMSEEIGAFADKTLEIQQGDGKAVVQLDGGNASVGGSKTQVYGATTINGKTEVKDELKAPKATIDNIEAKSSFKSPNISDGMSVPGAAGGGSLSAKLKAEDAPKE